MTIDKGIENALAVLGAQPREKVLLVYDSKNSHIAESFPMAARVKELELNVKLLQLDRDRMRIYGDVPPHIVRELTAFKPSIAINLLSPDVCGISCRISILRAETKLNCRIAHVPGAAEPIFSQYMAGNFRETIDINKRVRDYLNTIKVRKLLVTTKRGTELEIQVAGRRWVTDVLSLPGTLVNFPCGEVFVAPIETGVHGKLVCDVSIGDLGRIDHPATLTIVDGRCTRIEGSRRKEIEKILHVDKESAIVGEFGIGLNREITLSEEETLLLEKARGTSHLAFGSNEDFGGRNFSSVHTDFVFSSPSIFADGRPILESGELRI